MMFAPSSTGAPASSPLDLDDPQIFAALVTAGAAVFLLFLIFVVVAKFLYICPPNEVFVFSGRTHELPGGGTVGFKVVHGGRAFRYPLLETFSRMDVRLYGVEVVVHNAFSKGGIPLAVHAIANVKVATDPVRVRQAVERFLGVETSEILRVARQTLEGVLRETLSQLTPEEVNQNRLKFAETLALSAKDDFDKLGLELDVLKVQHVADDQKYLANLGRAQIAGMLRDATMAESEAALRVTEAEAAARQLAESALRQAEGEVLQAKNGMRTELAKLEGEARSIENEAKIAAETARATAEQELQGLRAELAKVLFEVDTVIPAEAAAKAAQLKARGDAAREVEKGRAAAEALNVLAAEWTAGGDIAKDAYVLADLDNLVRAASARVSQIEIEELNVLDGGDGKSLEALFTSHPRNVAAVLDETTRVLGIDVSRFLRGAAEGPRTERGGLR